MTAPRKGSLGVLTTKGDLLVDDGGNVERLAVGADGQTPVADSGEATGIKWALKLPIGYIAGIKISPGAIPDEDTAFAVGKCRDDADSFDIVVSGVLTADNLVSGVNGLDTGVVAADTLYSTWVIADSTGVNAVASLLSLSATAPTMPAGYDKKRRVGWVLTDVTSDNINFVQIGDGRTRRIEYDTTTGTANRTRVLTNGAAGVFTDVALSAFVPPTSTSVEMAAQFEIGAGGVTSDEGRLRPDGFSASGNNSMFTMQPVFVSTQKTHYRFDIPCPGQIIEYRVDDALNNQMTLSVAGYTDEL